MIIDCSLMTALRTKYSITNKMKTNLYALSGKGYIDIFNLPGGWKT
jgi:hypothetical protein